MLFGLKESFRRNSFNLLFLLCLPYFGVFWESNHSLFLRRKFKMDFRNQTFGVIKFCKSVLNLRSKSFEEWGEGHPSSLIGRA